MKQFKILPVILILTALISACGGGAPAVPTMSPVDVQNTAVAAAFTVVAQTQEAIPTATPLPPTDTPTVTPLATNTQIAFPTLEGTTTAIVAATSGSSNANTSSNANATSDPCATRVLNYSPKGQETIIRIRNNTKAQVTVSLYLNETPGKGECGYRSYSLNKGSDVVITDLVQGCYNLWAWSTTNKPHVNAGGGGCINNDDKWTFESNDRNTSNACSRWGRRGPGASR